jgi:hypothetical protein
VPKIPRNYFTGSHRVTLDHGIILPFSHCSRLELERGTRQLVYHYPLYPHIWLLVLVSKMPPVKQYILIKAACTRLQRRVRASSSSIAWSSKGYVTVVQDKCNYNCNYNFINQNCEYYSRSSHDRLPLSTPTRRQELLPPLPT